MNNVPVHLIMASLCIQPQLNTTCIPLQVEE